MKRNISMLALALASMAGWSAPAGPADGTAGGDALPGETYDREPSRCPHACPVTGVRG